MKAPIFLFNLRKYAVNLLIVFMLFSVSTFAFLGLNYVPTSTSNLSVVFHGDKAGENVSLMFFLDGETNGEQVKEILQILGEKNLVCTFFVNGTWTMANYDILSLIKSGGHEIGNGGFSSCDISKFSDSDIRKEIILTHEIVKNLVGVDMALFSPYGGSYTSEVVSQASNLCYSTILWTHKFLGMQDSTIENFESGDFIMFEVGESTVKVLCEVVEKVTANGLSFAEVGACI